MGATGHSHLVTGHSHNGNDGAPIHNAAWLRPCGELCGMLWKLPRKIRQLIIDPAGFVVVSGGRGSHRKFRHPKFAGAVNLSGNDGDDAKDYQEKQVRNAIREVTT